jgi:exonuclease SbcC
VPLKKLKLVNYQSHRNTTIQLASCITGLIGESLSGKTAFIRAIRWLCENRPSGFRFHSNFADNDKTTVRFVAEKTVSASKTSKEHVYRMGKKRFRKVGRNVPTEVSELINVSDINFQLQLDGPFLVTAPPGQVTKTISQISKTDMIEKAIARTRKRSNALQAERKVVSSDIEGIQLRLDELEVLDDLKPTMQKVDRIRRKIKRLLDEESHLEQVEPRIEELRKRIEASQKVDLLSVRLKNANRIAYDIESLKQEKILIIQAMSTKKAIAQTKDVHAKYSRSFVKLLEKKRKCPVCIGPIDSKAIKRILREMQI